jgi:hypothetical protein
MNIISLKFLPVIAMFMSVSTPILAEIKSPNYDFSTNVIEPFLPGSEMEKIKADKTILSDIFEDNGNQKIVKIKLKKANYQLDMFVQTKDEKVTDLFVRLPQHFNHDLLLADLQKKYKKQDKFIRKDLSALYTWNERDGRNIFYQGSCSLTCFPMFIEFTSTDKSVVPLYQKFNEAIPKW